jgi:hypothetical protein
MNMGDSRACVFKRFIEQKNYELSHLPLELYLELKGNVCNLSENDKFPIMGSKTLFLVKRNNKRKILKNLRFLAKVERVSKNRDVEGVGELAMKRKASQTQFPLLPQKRILKTYIKSKDTKVSRRTVIFRIILSKTGKKVVLFRKMLNNQFTNTMRGKLEDVAKISPANKKFRRQRMKVTLWDHVRASLDAKSKLERDTQKESKCSVTVGITNKCKEYIEDKEPLGEDDCSSLDNSENQSPHSSGFEENPAEWLSSLKKSFVLQKKQWNSFKKYKRGKKGNADSQVSSQTRVSSKTCITPIAGSALNLVPLESNIPKARQTCVADLKPVSNLIEKKGNSQVSVSVCESTPKEDHDFILGENSEIFNTGQTLCTSAQNNLFHGEDQLSPIFPQDLFKQDHCLFCSGKDNKYKWSNSKRIKNGNVKDYFPTAFWQTGFGCIFINVSAEFLDTMFLFPFFLFRDFLYHFVLKRKVLDYEVVSKIVSRVTGKDLRLMEIEKHVQTSFKNSFSSLIEWVLVFPRHMIKLWTLNAKESAVILRSLMIGWFSIFFFLTALIAVLRFLIPTSLLSFIFQCVKHVVAKKREQRTVYLAPVWKEEFIKNLVKPCNSKNFLFRIVCKFEKVKNLLKMLSLEEQKTSLNLDVAFDKGGLGFYGNVTWWTSLISSLVCVQGIARSISEFSVKTIDREASVLHLVLLLLRLLIHGSFLTTNVVLTSRYLDKSVFELSFIIVIISITLFIVSKVLTHVFSFDCNWTRNPAFDSSSLGSQGKQTMSIKSGQIIKRLDDSKVIFSSTDIGKARNSKERGMSWLVNMLKSIAEIILVACAFLWLINSISNPYKFHLERDGLRLFFGSGGSKFLYLNLASILVILFGFSENFSIILSPLLLVAYLCYKFRTDILFYFEKEISWLHTSNNDVVSTIVYNFPGVSRYFNLELLSLVCLLILEYILAFFQLSASRIMAKFHTATFRFLNIYLACIILMSAKTVLGKYVEILSSSSLVWLILALFTRTSMGSSMLVKTTAQPSDGEKNFLAVAESWLPMKKGGVKTADVRLGDSTFAKFLIKFLNLVAKKLSFISTVVGVKILDFGGRKVNGVASFKKGVHEQFDYKDAKIVKLRKICLETIEVSHNDLFAFEIGDVIMSASHVIKEREIYDATPDQVFKVSSQSEDVIKFLRQFKKSESFRDTYTDQVSFGGVPTYAEPPSGVPIFTPTPDGDVKLGVVKDCVTVTEDGAGVAVKTLGCKRVFYPHVKQGMSGMPIISPVGVVGSCGTHEVVPTNLYPSVVETVPGIKEFSGLCRIPIQDVKASDVMAKACQATFHSRFDLVAQTGSGKSTVFPIKLSLTNGDRKVILITPRVSAAINAYNRMILLIEEASLSLSCGLITGPKKEGTIGSNILVFTVGSFLFLLGFGGIDLSNVDVVLDEVHVHEGPMIATLEILEKRLKEKQLARLFTATATPVGCTIADLNPSADNFPIEMVQVDCDSTIDTHLMSNQENVTKTLLKHCGRVNMVFLPTISSLSCLEKKIIEVNAELLKSSTITRRIKVFKVHSLNMVAQLPLLRKRIHDLRRIQSVKARQNQQLLTGEDIVLSQETIFILTTNCLETGVTLDLDVVFSSGLVVCEKYDGVAHMSLFKRPISTQEFIQQRGRVGRVKPGKCVYFHLKKSPFISKLSYLPGDIDVAYSWLSLLGYGQELEGRNLLAKEISSKDYMWHKNVLLSPFRPVAALYSTSYDGRFKEIALDILKKTKSPGEVLVGVVEEDLNIPTQQVTINLSRFSPSDVDVFLDVLSRNSIAMVGKVDKKATVCVTYASKFSLNSLHILQLGLIVSKIEQDSHVEFTKGSSPFKNKQHNKLSKRAGPSIKNHKKDIITIETSIFERHEEETRDLTNTNQVVLIVERIPLEEFLITDGNVRDFVEEVFDIYPRSRDGGFESSAPDHANLEEVCSTDIKEDKAKQFEEVLMNKLKRYDLNQPTPDTEGVDIIKFESISADPNKVGDSGPKEKGSDGIDFLDALKQRYSFPNRNLKTSGAYLKNWIDQLQFSHVGFLAMFFLLVIIITSYIFLRSFLEVFEFLKVWRNLSFIAGIDVGMYVRVLIAFWYSTYFRKTSSFISKQKNLVLQKMSDCLDSIKVVRRTSPCLAVLSHLAVYKFAKKEGKKVAVKWRERIEPQLRLAGGGLNLKLLSKDCDMAIEKTGIQESIDEALFSTAFDPKLLLLLLIFSPITVLLALNLSFLLKIFFLKKVPTPIIWIFYAFPLGSSFTSLIQGNVPASLLFFLSIFSSHIDGIVGDVGTSLIRGMCLSTSMGNTFMKREKEGSSNYKIDKGGSYLYSREVLNNDAYSQTPFGLLKAEPLDAAISNSHCYIKFEDVKRTYKRIGLPKNLIVHDLGVFKQGVRRQGITAAYLLEKCGEWFPSNIIDLTAGKYADFCCSISRRMPNANIQAMTRETQFDRRSCEVPVKQLKQTYDVEVEGLPKSLVSGALYLITYSRQYPPNLEYVTKFSTKLQKLLVTLNSQKEEFIKSRIKLLIKVDEYLCMQDVGSLINLAAGAYPSACLDPLKPFELPTLWIHLDFSKKMPPLIPVYENWFLGLAALQCNRVRLSDGEMSVLKKREAILHFIKTRDLTFVEELCHSGEAINSRWPDNRCKALPRISDLNMEAPSAKVYSSSISLLKKLGFTIVKPTSNEKYCGFEVLAHCRGVRRNGSNGTHAPSGFRDWLKEETLVPVDDFSIDFADEWDRAVEKAIQTRMNKDCPATFFHLAEIEEVFSQLTEIVVAMLDGEKIGPLSWEDTIAQVNRASTMGKIDKLYFGHRKVGDFIDDVGSREVVDRCVKNYSMEIASLDTLYYLFPKDEKRFFEPRHIVDGVKVPRLISMHGGVMRITETMLFSRLSEVLYGKKKITVNGFPLFTNGLSKPQVAKLVVLLSEKFECSATEDFSAWDASITPALQILEYRFWKAICTEELKTPLKNYFVQDMLKLCCGPGGEIFRVYGQRASGAWNTSAGNGLINLVLQLTRLKRACGSCSLKQLFQEDRCHVLVEGDDSIVFSSQQILQRFFEEEVIAVDAGFSVKRSEDPIKRRPEDASYLSHGYTRVRGLGQNDDSYWPIRKLDVIVQRLSFLKRYNPRKAKQNKINEANMLFSALIDYFPIRGLRYAILSRLILMQLAKDHFIEFGKKYDGLSVKRFLPTELPMILEEIHGVNFSDLDSLEISEEARSVVDGDLVEDCDFSMISSIEYTEMLESLGSNSGKVRCSTQELCGIEKSHAPMSRKTFLKMRAFSRVYMKAVNADTEQRKVLAAKYLRHYARQSIPYEQGNASVSRRPRKEEDSFDIHDPIWELILNAI